MPRTVAGLTLLLFLQAYSFCSLFSGETVTQVTCPNGDLCRTGKEQHPALTGVRVPKVSLEAGDGTIENLVARYMKPTQSRCIEFKNLMLDSQATTRDIWLSLPACFFVTFIRESVSLPSFCQTNFCHMLHCMPMSALWHSHASVTHLCHYSQH